MNELEISANLLVTNKAEEWTHTTHQLILSADRNESVYVQATFIAAWLSAFATNVLEIDTLLYWADWSSGEKPAKTGRSRSRLNATVCTRQPARLSN